MSVAQKSWLTYEPKTLMNSRDKILRKVRRTNKGCDRSCYKRLKNSCNNKIKQAKQNHHKNLLLENCKNSKKFWKCIKDIFPTKKCPPVSATTSVDEVTNSKAANLLCEFFTNIADNLKHKVFNLRDFIWEKPQTPDPPENLFTFGYVSKVFV